MIRILITSAAILLASTMATGQAPLTLAPTGHPVVPVLVDGRPATFVLDTGAEGSAVYPDFARERALPLVADRERLEGQTSGADLPLRQIASLAIDGHSSGPLRAVELPARPDLARLDGIVGLDAIGDRLLDFDMPNGRAALLDRAQADAAIQGAGRPIAARRMAGGLLALPVRIGKVRGWAVIDTGARETRINTRFARAAGLPLSGDATMLAGATQTLLAQRGSVAPRIDLPGRAIRDARVQVADLPVFEVFGIAQEPAMLLGIDHLRRYRLLIDFSRARIWLR
jgi:predicted aspartyl protease